MAPSNLQIRYNSDNNFWEKSTDSGSTWSALVVDANLLSFEVGTFTPAITLGGGNTGITYSAQVGSYTRIGNRISFTIVISLTSKGSLTGNLLVTGLPFSSWSSSIQAVSTYVTVMGASLNSVVESVIPVSATTIQLRTVSGGVATMLTNSELSNTSNIAISGSYIKA